ncbi:MAG: response regulator [Candidatus Eremiobacteraeota bacterium]|nr:response regulator [Candidatus Eremiobacteraeota bacterium]MBV8284278.1 response regulator [Candidatus Eremiobacteraeota bacterium]MBV8432996.1 response regulator [Candidatus Eremiobacteraeota bacterium]
MRARILVVDGNRAHLAVISSALRPLGFTVVKAHNVADAYDVAREHLPSMILCDVRMKETDDAGFFAKLKADPELADVPLLFITSTATP